MKKFIKILLTAVFVAIIACSIVACDKDNKKDDPETPNNPSTPSDPDNPNTPGGHTHVYGEWEIVTNPTCTASGERKRTCSCGQEEKEPIAALGHEEVTDNAVAATCTEKGLTEGKHCSRCNAVIVAQTELDALGHEYEDEWTVDVDPTCTEKGSKSHHCKRCEDKTDVTEIAALGHKVNAECVCAVCGKTAHGVKDGQYCRHDSDIYFGTYPQGNVTDETLTAALSSSAGTLPTSEDSQSWTSYGYYVSGSVSNFMWYVDLTYNGEKYRGVYFTSYRPYSTTNMSSADNSSQDDNGYSTFTVYWFRYEPIKWKILSESDGKAMIVADMVIDSQQYCHYTKTSQFTHNGGTGYPNNYALSDIRKWLNDTFYNTAFNDLQKELIQVTNVDNSISSTGDSSNDYVCENTNDNVFLLSYKETNAYMTDSDRQKKNTDYAKCQGAFTSTDDRYSGNGYWWLRSPISYGSNRASHVNYYGFIVDRSVYNSYCGVLPALVIRLS